MLGRKRKLFLRLKLSPSATTTQIDAHTLIFTDSNHKICLDFFPEKVEKSFS